MLKRLSTRPFVLFGLFLLAAADRATPLPANRRRRPRRRPRGAAAARRRPGQSRVAGQRGHGRARRQVDRRSRRHGRASRDSRPHGLFEDDVLRGQGRAAGTGPRGVQLFEDDLNKKLNAKHVRVHVIFVPVASNELIPALLDGRGDIVAAGKLVTAWRKEQVDFTNATRTGISTIIVSGPAVPPIANVTDLGGKEVYLRASDVSDQGVAQFNAQLAKAGKPPVHDPPCAGSARRRRPPRDGQRRARAHDDGGRLRRGVLEAGVPGSGAQHGRGGPHRRRDGDDGPQEQPPADGRAEQVPGEVSGGVGCSATC